MEIALPSTCFISHAYTDAAALDRILGVLPPHVHPYIFPTITTRPDQFVSGELIKAILNCDGLIYLRGGNSDYSFWVAFERDYAIRAGKKCFSVDLETMEVVRDTSSPLDLAAFASYHHDDLTQVREVAEHLLRERYFDLWLDVDNLNLGQDIQTEIAESLTNRLKRGGYAIIFWSQKASESLWVRRELEEASREISAFNDRVLFALLDNCPLPEFWNRFQEPYVQLYGDAIHPTAHRIDDLVVRLYWLIYRKTKRAN